MKAKKAGDQVEGEGEKGTGEPVEDTEESPKETKKRYPKKTPKT